MTEMNIKKIQKCIEKTIDKIFVDQLIKLKCIVKKINTYNVVYIELADIDDQTSSIQSRIYKDLFDTSIKVNDMLEITGSVAYYKQIYFDIKSCKKLQNNVSSMDLILNQLNETYDLNKQKKNHPKKLKSIGIISSVNASGLKDLLDVLQNSLLDNISVYPCTLQGYRMENSFLNAFKKAVTDEHDLLIITRGGGSKTDLEWFNNYNICVKVLECNIPVYVAIGHETDKSALDIIADKSFNTPTLVACYIDNICKTIYEDQINKVFNMYNNKIYTHIETLNKEEKLFNNLIKEMERLCNLYNSSVYNICKKYDYLDSQCETLLKQVNDYYKESISVIDLETNREILTKQEFLNIFNDSNGVKSIALRFLDGELIIEPSTHCRDSVISSKLPNDPSK